MRTLETRQPKLWAGNIQTALQGAGPGSDRYASLARWYDLTASRALFTVHARIAALCAERGFARVLDAGCGTGRLAAMLRAKGIRVAGLDSSPAMLARALCDATFPADVPLVLGGMPFPFAPQSFDAVILSLVLHESEEEPEKLLAEALRAAPVCVVLEWRMPERNLDYLAQPLVHAIERIAGKGHYARFRHFVSGGYLHGAAMRAGARVISEEAFKAATLVLAEVAAAPRRQSMCTFSK